jgi:hypothetical protein
MGVNDGGAGARAGNTVGDDRLDGVGNARLQGAAPGAVQRRFDPDLAHRGISFCFSVGTPCGASDNPPAIKRHRRSAS